MQNTLSNTSGALVRLNKGVHHALNDCRWMHANIASDTPLIFKLVHWILSQGGIVILADQMQLVQLPIATLVLHLVYYALTSLL